MLISCRFIQKNLFAVARTSKIHREELKKHVNSPNLIVLTYKNDFQLPDTGAERSYLGILRQLYKETKAQCRSDNKVSSDSVECSFIYYRNLFSKASVINRSVGRWAAEWFVKNCVGLEDDIDPESENLYTITADSKTCKRKLFEAIEKDSCPKELEISDQNMSSRTLALVRYLGSEVQPGFKTLIFAEQRGVVVALARLLSDHPNLKDKLSVGTCVGTSAYKRTRESAFREDAQVSDQEHVLEDFRTGQKNLIVTTSVLEEGIDISSCRIVICFDLPKNPISFIQRRGRARQPNSKFILIIPESESTSSKIQEWRALELRIREAAEDDLEPKNMLPRYEYQERHRFVVLRTGYVTSLFFIGSSTLA